jgi:hypothetical protein
MRILGGVAAKWGENPHRRKGQGSSATLVSRGLVDPKCSPNRGTRKGSRLIFLHHAEPCPSSNASRQVDSSCLAIQPPKSPECRHGEKGMNAGVRGQPRPLIRGARENDDGVIPCVRT